MPTVERLGKWAKFDDAEKCWRFLHRKHERLVHFFNTAAKLEDEGRWNSRW